jgi:hypothetical protein
MIINDVAYDVAPLLYGILGHAPIYYSYVHYGVYFRVYKYGDDYIHLCHYYFFVSALPF